MAIKIATGECDPITQMPFNQSNDESILAERALMLAKAKPLISKEDRKSQGTTLAELLKFHSKTITTIKKRSHTQMALSFPQKTIAETMKDELLVSQIAKKVCIEQPIITNKMVEVASEIKAPTIINFNANPESFVRNPFLQPIQHQIPIPQPLKNDFLQNPLIQAIKRESFSKEMNNVPSLSVKDLTMENFGYVAPQKSKLEEDRVK